MIDVARRMASEHVLERLSDLFVGRGSPRYLRSESDPEFTATRVRQWLAQVEVKTLFIEPGCVWENGYIESFNANLCDELLNREILETRVEAKVLIERWRVNYSTVRPHSTLDYHSPAPETVQPHKPASATLQQRCAAGESLINSLT